MNFWKNPPTLNLKLLAVFDIQQALKYLLIQLYVVERQKLLAIVKL